ncbi:MAG: AAA family ATPase [Ignavibacteriales bacterium]|nr:MAG: AAA family ATPase [Ignavibacteriaceae bacterium]MBW7872897.1 AAA family ATPase [Ignavibacteria bacterium]MCZ2142474.1 AAA family ATPase [Ignavibacteriales bacterium]OQY76280.1 MAG: hypothetical protein B6D45_04050 [Ignavibacteriales bacterium UTCHB3]MBV6445356.1 hypothetical protein [Ignavibacteriaceae bacterium]
MKICISNFGPIKKFEIDLSKKITLIYGENNIGKSYAMSIVYMLLKALSNVEVKRERINEFGSLFSSREKADFEEAMEVIGKDFVSESISDRNLDLFRNHLSHFIESILSETFVRSFREYLSSSYGNYDWIRNQFARKSISPEIEILTKSFNISLKINDEGSNSNVIRVDFANDFFTEICEDLSRTENFSPNFYDKIYRKFFIELFNQVRENSFNLNYLPAARSGIYFGFSNFGTFIAKINLCQRGKEQLSFTIPHTTVPISDFILKFSEAKIDFVKNKFSTIAGKIETQILKGTVELEKETGKIRYFSDEIGKVFELSNTSSMVSEISILTAFIKFILYEEKVNGFRGRQTEVEKGNVNSLHSQPLLFIEEPEAHLHPKTQIKLMKLLIELSKAGVQVIMTTHSDFMLNTLSNQILSEKIKSNDVGSILMVFSKEGSVSSDKMQPQEDGIRDQNFLKTTEELYRERIRLHEKRNAKLDSKDRK